ncbi:MAG: amidohydrolase family protein, partial [Planctomycetia bacterium]
MITTMPRVALVCAAGAACMILATLAVAAPAERIIRGGPIVTVNAAQPAAEAVAIAGGRIVAVGSEAEVMRHKGPATEVTDLAGKTLVPGFIDAHGHMVYAGKNLLDADLFGSVDVADVLARMKAHATRVPAGAWIVGFGYK